MKQKDYLIVLIFFTICIFLPTAIWIWNIQPINETLICNSNKICTLEQTRFFNIKKRKIFEVYPYYELKSQNTYVEGSSNSYNLFEISGNIYRIFINNENVFSFPYCVDDCYGTKCKQLENSLEFEFEKYKKQPKLVFYLSSLANISVSVYY